MYPFLLLDFQTFGSLVMMIAICAATYMIYRDVRLMMQMIVDLREDFMLLQMSKRLGTPGRASELSRGGSVDAGEAGEGLSGAGHGAAEQDAETEASVASMPDSIANGVEEPVK